MLVGKNAESRREVAVSNYVHCLFLKLKFGLILREHVDKVPHLDRGDPEGNPGSDLPEVGNQLRLLLACDGQDLSYDRI